MERKVLPLRNSLLVTAPEKLCRKGVAGWLGFLVIVKIQGVLEF